MAEKRVAVLGAGIIGLTSALALSKAGYLVTIYAKSFSPDTTSDQAAAIWWADYAAEESAQSEAYQRRVEYWARDSWALLHELADDPRWGVSPQSCVIFPEAGEPLPLIASIIPDFQSQSEPSLGAGRERWSFTSYMMEVPFLQKRLMEELRIRGVQFKHYQIDSHRDVHAVPETVLINCLAMGAAPLFGDTSMIPVRGQLIKVRPQKLTAKVSVAWKGHHLYWSPRSDCLILGGSLEPGESQELPTAEVADRIWSNLADFIEFGACGLPTPELNVESIISMHAAIRPFRKEGVRLEEEYLGTKKIIHNYGHGDCGFSTAFGCSRELVKLVE